MTTPKRGLDLGALFATYSALSDEVRTDEVAADAFDSRVRSILREELKSVLVVQLDESLKVLLRSVDVSDSRGDLHAWGDEDVDRRRHAVDLARQRQPLGLAGRDDPSDHSSERGDVLVVEVHRDVLVPDAAHDLAPSSVGPDDRSVGESSASVVAADAEDDATGGAR